MLSFLFMSPGRVGTASRHSLPPEPPDQLTEPTCRFGGVVAAGLQEGEDFSASCERGEISRRRTALIRHRVGAGVEEQSGDLDVALESHAAQRRLALVVAEVDRGARLQQQLHDLRPAMVTGQHQQRVALGVA